MQPRIAMNDDPVRLGLAALSGAFVLDLLIESERLAQVIQKYAWQWPDSPGVLGQWVDARWLQVVYSSALALLLLAAWLLRRRNPAIWRAGLLAGFALTFAGGFQTLLSVEQVARFVQAVLGDPHPLGLFGRIFPVLEFDFWSASATLIAICVTSVGLAPWEKR
jgi:hypothetical protein